LEKKERIPALLILSGPTASGKSSLAESLALEYGFPIISADSRQIYRGFDIGTAKPSSSTLSKVHYEMIDILEPYEKFSAGKFARQAAELIYGALKEKRIIIITGGTGFYISALTEGLANIPGIETRIDQKWDRILANQGLPYLQKEIGKLDPRYAAAGDLQNKNRLLRAIKIADQTGQSILDYSPQPFLKPYHPVGYFAIHRDREDLYHRINARVDQMIESGLVEEVRRLLHHRDCPAMNTVGYKELIPYLELKIPLEEAVENIKQHSRNYAKRQMTWLRRNKSWNWIDVKNPQPLREWIDLHTQEG